MDRDVEAVPDGRRHAGPRGRLVLRAPALHEGQDVLGALVGALGPARPRQEPGDPAGGEGRVRQVEGLAARPEGRGHGRDGPTVDAMAAQHLVLHLDVIPRIEELMLRERLVPHALRAGMQGAGRTEGRGFGILGGPAARRHVTIIMYPLS